MNEVFNSTFLKWQFLVQERSINPLKTDCIKKLVQGKGLQKEYQNEVVKSNFLHTLRLNDLIGPIKDDYGETKTINDATIVF